MRKIASHLVVTLSCAAMLTGCALSHGPVVAPITLKMKGPVSAGPSVGSAKVGKAEAW